MQILCPYCGANLPPPKPAPKPGYLEYGEVTTKDGHLLRISRSLVFGKRQGFGHLYCPIEHQSHLPGLDYMGVSWVIPLNAKWLISPTLYLEDNYGKKGSTSSDQDPLPGVW